MDSSRTVLIFHKSLYLFESMILDHLYLILDFFALSYPLAQSFEKRITFYKKWYALFPAIFAVGFVFIVWDSIFTMNGIWGFNDRYLVGWDLFHLPLEEWLFFLFVPYACIFIYECTIYFIKSRPLQKVARPLAWVVAVAIIFIGLLNLDKWYTSLTFLGTGAFLIGHLLLVKKDYLDRFWIGYFFSLIPFMLVNGVLTGTGIEDQIVWYNNAENLSIRIFTIPIEDSVYLLLYLLMIVTIYEEILKRWDIRKTIDS